MLGAIVGDIIGSPYEFNNHRSTDFTLFPPEADFTDDTVLTVAVAEAILEGRPFHCALQHWYLKYPHCSFGGSFHNWGRSGGSAPYGSWGNGSAMRVSPCGWAGTDEMEALELAHASAAVTHNHAEGIKGAQAVALAIFMARNDCPRERIAARIAEKFGYELDHDLEQLRAESRFDVSCQGSVPQAITCFLQAEDFEDSIRKAVSIGGDSDTIAAITGSIAEAWFGGVPESILATAWKRIPLEMREFIEAFHIRHGLPGHLPDSTEVPPEILGGR